MFLSLRAMKVYSGLESMEMWDSSVRKGRAS